MSEIELNNINNSNNANDLNKGKELIREEVDPNMLILTEIKEPDIKFYDVREAPFEIYGLYDAKNQAAFKRLPDEVAMQTSKGVTKLYLDTAGGRIRFSSDSQYVAIKAVMPFVDNKSHMPLTGTSGFDLYIDYTEPGAQSRFHGLYKPDVRITDGYESILKFSDRRPRYFTINMPSYNHVDRLYIGLQRDAAVGGGKKYLDRLPIVYYGSSITQGACSSRPGMTYQNIISRHLEYDYINLGFSGNGKAELPIVEYMAGLDMLMFVSDYDHNAPNAEYLEKTHCRMYQMIRASHPDIPYIMLSRPDFDRDFDQSVIRRNVIIDTFRYARENGDKNVYYIDGQGIYLGGDEDNCTVDNSHPNDYGFIKMADAIERVMVHALRKVK